MNFVLNFYVSYKCLYLGDQCSVLCFNGGTCNKDNCTCKNGFTGKFCESRKFLLISMFILLLLMINWENEVVELLNDQIQKVVIDCV